LLIPPRRDMAYPFCFVKCLEKKVEKEKRNPKILVISNLKENSDCRIIRYSEQSF